MSSRSSSEKNAKSTEATPRSTKRSTRNVKTSNQAKLRNKRTQTDHTTEQSKVQNLPLTVQSIDRDRTQDLYQNIEIQMRHGAWAIQRKAVITQMSLSNSPNRTTTPQRPVNSAPASTRISPSTSQFANPNTSQALLRNSPSATAGTSRGTNLHRGVSNMSSSRLKNVSSTVIKPTQPQAPPWVHPNSFYRPKPEDPEKLREKARLEKKRLRLQQQKREREESAAANKYCGLIYYIKQCRDVKIKKFLLCIGLEKGSVIIGSFCIFWGMISFIFLAIILAKFPDWKFVYRNKIELLAFIMYHSVITMLLFIYGILMTIGVKRESRVLLNISLGGLWLHVALTWIGLGVLAIFCTVQGYCFQTETFPVLLLKFVTTVAYSGFWLYFIWTVNSFRRTIVDVDDGDDDNY